jgi:hypothetical protein
MGELYKINEKTVTLFQKDIEWYSLGPVGNHGPIVTEDIELDLQTARNLATDPVLLEVIDIIRHKSCIKCNSKEMSCITSLLKELHSRHPQKISWPSAHLNCFLIDMIDWCESIFVWIAYREERCDWIVGIIQIAEHFSFVSSGCDPQYTRMVEMSVDEYKKFASEIQPF